jgi:hypothetical protein
MYHSIAWLQTLSRTIKKQVSKKVLLGRYKADISEYRTTKLPYRNHTAQNNELRTIHIERHRERSWNSVAASCRNFASTCHFLAINTFI